MSQAVTRRLRTLLPRAASRAAQWRPLLLLVVLGWIPTALLAVPLWRVMAENLDGSVHAAQWARQVDVVMLADLMGRIHRGSSALSGAAIAAATVFALLMPFQHAVLVTAARTDERLRMGELLHAGLREYGPMLRMLFVSLIPLGLALAVALLAFKGVGKFSEHAIVESDVDSLSWTADLLAGGLLVLALAGIEAGRARLAIDPRRRSAFMAWWRGFKLVLFNPLPGLGIFLGISIPALIAVAALSLVRVQIDTASGPGLIAGWLVVQLLAATLIWAHFARLAAYFELTRAAQHDATAGLRPRSL